ncbi:MAG TPA: hypothetical protein VD995_09660 [Azospirillum sp.]|nr:hypothetical protein [Azospirillum sp.]
MPLRLLLPTLSLVGWACIAAGVALASAAFLWPAGGWPAAAVALTVLGAGVVAGLMLIGFAANLRLIATLLERVDRAAPRRDGG